MQKRYTFFFALIMFCLVALLILPGFVIKQPRFDSPNLAEKPPHLPPLNSVIPAPLFEEINMILLFGISIFASIAVRTKQNEPPTEHTEPAFEQKQENRGTFTQNVAERLLL